MAGASAKWQDDTYEKSEGKTSTRERICFQQLLRYARFFWGGPEIFRGNTSFFWIAGEVIQLDFLSSYPLILDHHVYTFAKESWDDFFNFKGDEMCFHVEKVLF